MGSIRMQRSFANILLQPDLFFQDLVTKRESLGRPALIILAAGIAAAVYAFLVGGLTARMIAGIMPGMETIIILSTAIGALLFTFVFWILWAGVIFALSWVFKGKGSFKRTMEIVGYGYLPQIFGIIVTCIVALFYVPQVHVPELTAAAVQDPLVIQEMTKALMHDPAMLALTQITAVVSIAFFLLSANIWIFGLKHARTISLRNAAICIGVAVVGYSIYILSMMTVI
jgi:hypothetical protein